ncbi:MAG TPA: PAS domain S-box protein, partial [Anaerolineae bacterium]|nr:PAS domain S-box protein [Anaerolineae bacterium]
MTASTRLLLVEPDESDRQLIRQEDRYRLMLDTVQDAMLVCDSDGKIVQANLAAERLLAHSMPELIGKPVRRWLAAASGELPPLASLAGSHPIRLILRKPPAPVEVRVKALALDEQPAYVIAMRDLRREERASQLLRAFTAAAAAMQAALTPLDVFRAAGEQLRSTGLALTVFRLVEDGSALVVWYTELASRVIEYAQRVTGFDPLAYAVPVADAPILQSILASDSPQILLDCVEVIREMLPARLKKL